MVQQQQQQQQDDEEEGKTECEETKKGHHNCHGMEHKDDT